MEVFPEIMKGSVDAIPGRKLRKKSLEKFLLGTLGRIFRSNAKDSGGILELLEEPPKGTPGGIPSKNT